jgi:hypothetical protein
VDDSRYLRLPRAVFFDRELATLREDDAAFFAGLPVAALFAFTFGARFAAFRLATAFAGLRPVAFFGFAAADFCTARFAPT